MKERSSRSPAPRAASAANSAASSARRARRSSHIDISPAVKDFAEELRKEGIDASRRSSTSATTTAVKAAFADLPEDFASIDILINNAGVSHNPALGRTTPEGWRDDVNANLNGAYNCTYAVLAGMKARGRRHRQHRLGQRILGAR